jgi:phosphomannomutase
VLLTCFKAYDIRGKLGDELNEKIAYLIGRATGFFLRSETQRSNLKIAVGGDIRPTSAALKKTLIDGFLDSGCDVVDLGMTGTEEVYAAVQSMNFDGGVEVTASHNPIEYNGMKLVRANARPISNDSGLLEIKRLAERRDFPEVATQGILSTYFSKETYLDTILKCVHLKNIRPLRVVVNPGHGSAGPVLIALENYFQKKQIPIEFVKVFFEPDGSFPQGIPNPMLMEQREPTCRAVIEYQADFGVAWDGDFDRCFLFDERGCFIEGYYIVGLLTQAFLTKNLNEKVIHDPRVYWNTQQLALSLGSQAIVSKTGHAFIKEKMRKENAIYGGEMSAHHYFRDFAYCDSGMIPWLLIAELVSEANVSLSALVQQYQNNFPSSGEINRQVENPQAVLQRVRLEYADCATSVDELDGLSLEFEHWRFNLRCSNTEPVMRLNVESRQDVSLMQTKTEALLALIH